jgi:glycosyltransferase involved in cell wall biosynthesis
VSAVVQLLAAASPGDAVTQQAFAWGRLLADWGYAAEIRAEHVHPALAGRVRRLTDAGGLGEAPVVLHASIWSSVVGAALEHRGPLAVQYHNITPGDLLRPWNETIAADCDRARSVLPALAARADVLLAVSAFNAAELAAAGGIGATVVPLLLDVPEAVPAPRPPGPPSVLSVGRIAPNKRLEDVIRAFALYRRHHAGDATLTLVGGAGGFERYRTALERLATRVGGGVRFAGWIPDEQLEAAYRGAHAYLCMSEHEGFCAPLVEAMARSLPVVARDAGAVRETVGGAGVVIERDLPLTAEALHEVVSSEGTRRGLARAAAARLRALDPDAVAARLQDALQPVLAA